ncbi:MAG: tetrathionate reductase family octaheme c-type cytochrome [Anaerolineae bacterium]|nr:tetrathionate reductase family octaheme c-type cytochrome [Anaerolineae bacterium]
MGNRNALVFLMVGMGCLLLGIGLLVSASPAVAAAPANAPAQGVAQGATADHSKFEILKGPFATGPEVTAACLTCHTEAAKQVMQTTHWTWEQKVGDQQLGKNNVVNNFCVAIASNEPRCTSCHVGYGYRDKTFFTSAKETNVDCLVCHDTTGTYKKFPPGAGHPAYEPREFPAGSGKMWNPPDLALVAQNVGKTSRATCGACHFSGGGGDAVKHGDLDTSLIKPSRELDVHMGVDGLNFTCSTCHTAVNHFIAGGRYVMQAKDVHGIDVPGRDDQSRASCESCHGLAPHKTDAKLNDHVERVACETCHIPAFARGNQATKMWWDWSAAGRLNAEGKPFKKKNEEGYEVYDSQKGEFTWERNVIPEYVWFNGEIEYTVVGSKVEDPNKLVVINALKGSPDDGKSRIWPVKAFRARQPYDPKTGLLIVPNLFPNSPEDKDAFWRSFDWVAASRTGMETVNLPFSGEVAFVESVMYWPQTHMVAPKEKALDCEACHSPNGRLAALTNFYMPGRLQHEGLNTFGTVLVGAVLVAVIGHGTLRLILRKNGKKS